MSYSLISWLKLFIGYKYQPTEMYVDTEGIDKVYSSYSANPPTPYQRYVKTTMNIKLVNHCPAAGIGVSFPFYEVFTFNANLSALYLKGSMDYRHQQTIYNNADIDNPSIPDPVDAPMNLKGWGYNLEPSLAAVLKENILLVIGFRYQMMAIRGTFGEGQNEIVYSDMKDHVYGAYFNVMYRFN